MIANRGAVDIDERNIVSDPVEVVAVGGIADERTVSVVSQILRASRCRKSPKSRSDKRDAIIVTFQEKKPEWSFPRTRP